MRYGIEIVNLGDLADPRTIVRMASAAEEAGWEILVLWHHLGYVWGAPATDPFVTLAGVAQATRRIRLATGVTPLPRYQPHMLAQTLATLDILSDGRVTLGAGLGAVAEESAAFAAPTDPKTLAAMTDEALAVMAGLWSGEPLTHHGAHYAVEGVTFAPTPLQRPRIPIWVGGTSPAALRRAARWDGWIVGGASQDGTMGVTPGQIAEQLAVIRGHRTAGAPFDVAMSGYSTPGDGALAREYAEAGVTWWIESLHLYRGSVDELLGRIIDGPPRG